MNVGCCRNTCERTMLRWALSLVLSHQEHHASCLMTPNIPASTIMHVTKNRIRFQ